jgi:hypothetical protein
MVPLDFERLKGLVEDRLKYGDCATYVAKLIDVAASLPNDGGQRQPTESTNILSNLDKIRSQPKGGVLFQRLTLPHPYYPNIKPGSGGRGWAWGSFAQDNATINVIPDGYYSNIPEREAHVLHGYGITGLHEVIHMSAKWGTYNDAHLTRAARTLEPDVEITDWDNALKRHCLPSRYH